MFHTACVLSPVRHSMRKVFPPDVIEAALAHVDKNEVRRAYNRSDYLEQRRPMMQWWADFVKAADSGSIVLIVHPGNAACGMNPLSAPIMGADNSNYFNNTGFYPVTFFFLATVLSKANLILSIFLDQFFNNGIFQSIWLIVAIRYFLLSLLMSKFDSLIKSHKGSMRAFTAAALLFHPPSDQFH